MQVLRAAALSRARKGKRVLGRKGNPCSERGFPFLPKKTERSKGTPPLKRKNIFGYTPYFAFAAKRAI